MNTILIICLAVALILLTLSVWYIRKVLIKLLFVSEHIGDFTIKMIEFKEHLDTVNKLDTYYGDVTLENLLRHSKAIELEVQKFVDIYSITTEIEEDYEIDDETGTEAEAEENF
jgi:hypothetical protein|tara:strand:+ start:339 stop:680 length:342 start_codon:yes stop_codon:yes gene_type:complete